MVAVERRRLEYIWQQVGVPFTVLTEAAFKQLVILILEAAAESEKESGNGH